MAINLLRGDHQHNRPGDIGRIHPLAAGQSFHSVTKRRGAGHRVGRLHRSGHVSHLSPRLFVISMPWCNEAHPLQLHLHPRTAQFLA